MKVFRGVYGQVKILVGRWEIEVSFLGRGIAGDDRICLSVSPNRLRPSIDLHSTCDLRPYMRWKKLD